MSYILDALKKAESERNLGAIPDLHAQAYADTPANTRTSAWRKPWLWIVLALLIATAAVLAFVRPWTAMMPASPPPAAPSVVTPPSPPSAPQGMPQPAPAAAAPPATAKPQIQAAPQASPSALTPVEKKPTVQASPKVAAAEPKPSTPAAKLATPATPPAAPPEEPIPTLRELPDNIQQQIPKFSTNGYLYSSNKADRTVLINQKLLHEGDRIAPDLTLETLTPSGMVLNYKGYRYRTSY